MRISTMKYTVQQGLRNIGKNKMFSIASIITMIACIFVFGVFFSLIVNVQGVMKSVEEKIPIVIYFDKDATDDDIALIKDKLLQREDVLKVEYVSAEQAWKDFQDIYFGEGSNVEGFEENPLADSDNYEVYMKDVSSQEEIVEYAKGLSGVRKVRASSSAAETLKNISILLATVSGVIIAILLIVAIFLISNTVAMGITIRREEIAIMKYIGAKDSFVRAPFIFEGVLIGLVGAIIPLILLFFAYQSAVDYVATKFSALMSFIPFLPVEQVYIMLLPVGLALGVGIGFLGSILTIKKHLNA